MNQFDDPFAPEADPDFDLQQPIRKQVAADTDCERSNGGGVSRRAILAGVGALSMIPMTAAADVLQIPCVQEAQRVKRCRHRFCRHYGGVNDYHHRR